MTIEKKALALWDVNPTNVTLAAKRENIVHRVTTKAGDFALRQHRSNYRTDAEIKSELDWMNAVSNSAGLSVPRPVPSKNGGFLALVDGVQFDMLSWLPGRQLGSHGTPLNLPDPVSTFQTLGKSMAALHIASDAWTPPADFSRPAWDSDGLVGETPLWGRFWENPTLSSDQKALFEAFRASARQTLEGFDHDFGLIHADLLRENILVDGDKLRLIDFDDGGPGFRLFELATTLFRIKDEAQEPALRAALLHGYQSIRPLDTTQLAFFLALRACTYVGWIVTRMDLDRAAQRNDEHIRNAIQAIEKWQTTEPHHV